MHRLILAIGAVLFVGVRVHVLDDGIPNPDIAGILYNADGLLQGALPYVDSMEFKPPGAFVLVAGIFAVFGRGLVTLQLMHALWLLVGAAGVAVIARHLARDTEAPVAKTSVAIAVAVYLCHAPMFTYGYAAWMVVPSVWAVAAALVGLHEGRMRWHVLAGVAAMLAYVTIQRAAVLGVLMAAMWLLARRRKTGGGTRDALLGWAAGATVVLGALMVPYIPGGHVGVLLEALFPFGFASRYVEGVQTAWLSTVAMAVGQLLGTFWFALALIAVGAVTSRRCPVRGTADDVWWLGLAWLVASVCAAAIGGGRFYLHYLVQYVPALAVLAGHPALARALLGGETPGRHTTLVRLAVGALTAAQLVEIGLGAGHRYEAKARRLEDGRTAAQAAAAHIRDHTAPADPIACWGWTAWPVYYWAQRRAPGRIYKPLGSVTTFNANTAFAEGRPITLTPGAMTEQYIAEFDRNPPAYFVYSPSFESTFGARPDPLQQFAPLLERLGRDYVPDAAYGDLRLFRRRPGPF